MDKRSELDPKAPNTFAHVKARLARHPSRVS